jgi:hypothetical protein
MTLIKGAYFKGVMVEGARSFASIPGLMMWCEADYGVELDSNNFVVKVADRSGRQNDIVGSRPSFRSTLISLGNGFYAIQSTGANVYNVVLNANTKGWEPLAKKGPFGIFSIYSTNGDGQYFVAHGVNLTQNQFWLRVTPTGAVQEIVAGSAWNSVGGLVNLDNSFYAIDLISYGYQNNPTRRLYLNTNMVAQRATVPYDGTETADPNPRILITNSSNINQLVMLLIYDWAGYTPAQIDSFRQQVNAIREEKYGSIF